MISQGVVDQIRSLLAQGKSHCEIARALGVSRGTVRRLARGDADKYVRPGSGPMRLHVFLGQPTRCPSCGARVYRDKQFPPCLACRIDPPEGRHARAA